MNIGTIILTLFSAVFAYQIISVYRSRDNSIPSYPLGLVPQQVGRTRSIQSLTGDASMYTQLSRRKAIASQRYCGNTLNLPKKAIRETRTSTGSHTGYLDTYMISSLCSIAPPAIIPTVPPSPPTITEMYEFEGGNSNTQVVDYVLDGNSATDEIFDGGNANTHQYNEYSGGDALTSFVNYIFDNNILNIFYDGGHA
jgi:hypothetical protein